MIYLVDSAIQRLNNWGQKQYPDLGGNMSSVWNQTSFRKETSGGVAKSQLFSRAKPDVNPHIRLESSKGSLSLWDLEKENFIYSPYSSIRVQICLFLEI